MRSLSRHSRVATSVGVSLLLCGGWAEAQSEPLTGAAGPPAPTRLLIASTAPMLTQNTAPPAKRRDSVLNGVLIGAGVGGLLGLIPDHYDDCEECHDSLYASIAVGAGVGLVVDLLRGDTRPAAPSRFTERVRVGVASGRRVVSLRGVFRW